jgi:hypothetical protein
MARWPIPQFEFLFSSIFALSWATFQDINHVQTAEVQSLTFCLKAKQFYCTTKDVYAKAADVLGLAKVLCKLLNEMKNM